MNEPPRLGPLGHLLLALSRSPEDSGATEPAEGPVGPLDPSALDELLEVHPGLLDEVRGTRVLDFGCGDGHQAVAIARRADARVVGLDVQPDCIARARRLARAMGVEERATFTTRLAEDERYDRVISLNSMEHFANPGSVLRSMRDVLAPGGSILVSFCPTWLAPYGAHMHFFTRVPWVHVLFPERTVMAVRARFRDDGARRYEEVPGGLNRMTVRRFRRLVREAGLEARSERVDYVKDLAVLGRFPPTAEFFSNRVAAVLVPAGPRLSGGEAATPPASTTPPPP